MTTELKSCQCCNGTGRNIFDPAREMPCGRCGGTGQESVESAPLASLVPVYPNIRREIPGFDRFSIGQFLLAVDDALQPDKIPGPKWGDAVTPHLDQALPEFRGGTVRQLLLDVEKLLVDAAAIRANASKVFDHVTDGRYANAGTRAECVIEAANKKVNEWSADEYQPLIEAAHEVLQYMVNFSGPRADRVRGRLESALAAVEGKSQPAAEPPADLLVPYFQEPQQPAEPTAEPLQTQGLPEGDEQRITAWLDSIGSKRSEVIWGAYPQDYVQQILCRCDQLSNRNTRLEKTNGELRNLNAGLREKFAELRAKLSERSAGGKLVDDLVADIREHFGVGTKPAQQDTQAVPSGIPAAAMQSGGVHSWGADWGPEQQNKCDQTTAHSVQPLSSIGSVTVNYCTDDGKRHEATFKTCGVFDPESLPVQFLRFPNIPLPADYQKRVDNFLAIRHLTPEQVEWVSVPLEYVDSARANKMQRIIMAARDVVRCFSYRTDGKVNQAIPSYEKLFAAIEKLNAEIGKRPTVSVGSNVAEVTKWEPTCENRIGPIQSIAATGKFAEINSADYPSIQELRTDFTDVEKLQNAVHKFLDVVNDPNLTFSVAEHGGNWFHISGSCGNVLLNFTKAINELRNSRKKSEQGNKTE